MAFRANTMSDEEWESWRYVQDDVADKVADALLHSSHAREVYYAVSQIRTNDDLIHVDLFAHEDQDFVADEEHHKLVKILVDYFNDLSLFPTQEEDLKAIHDGCEFFNLFVGDCLFALTLRSLLKQYAAYRATNVLTATKLLVDYPHRRIVETLQFVADVMDINGFTPKGQAIRSIQKLRLVHAMVRHRINHKQQDPSSHDPAISIIWNDEWGRPINQQDMIFAVHTFSIEVLDGLNASGLTFPKEQFDAYYKTWHLFGKALGVHDDINPTNYAEGKILQERIYKKEFVPNENALALTPPLIEFAKAFIPGEPNETHIYAMAKRYNDAKDYVPVFEEILNIPISNANLGWAVWFFILDYARYLFDIIMYAVRPKKDEHAYMHMLAERNTKILQKLVELNKTWSGKSFQIADGFGEAASKIDSKMVTSEPSLLKRFTLVINDK